MTKLLTPADVAGILQVSKRSAYDYMGQMVHLQNPLRVTEQALQDWINKHAVDPEAKISKRTKRNVVLNYRIERR